MDQTDQLRLAASPRRSPAPHTAKGVTGPGQSADPATSSTSSGRRAAPGFYRTQHRDRTHQSRVAPFTTRLGDQRMAQLGRRRRWAGRAPSRAPARRVPASVAEQEQAAVHGLLLLVVQPGSHGRPTWCPRPWRSSSAAVTRPTPSPLAPPAAGHALGRPSGAATRVGGRMNAILGAVAAGSSGRVIDAHQSA